MPSDRVEVATPLAVLARRTLVIVGVVLAVALPLWLIADAVEVFLLTFAGILVGVILRGLAEWVSRLTRLKPGWSLALVVLVLAGLIFGACWLIGSRVSDEFAAVSERLPQGIKQAETYLQNVSWGRWLLQHAPTPGQLLGGSAGRWEALLADIVSAVVRAVVDALLVLVVGIYTAAAPDLYVAGIVGLVPRAGRDRARELLHVLAAALRHWALGRATAMVVIGTLTGVGLWLLGMPDVLALAVLAGLLEIIPYIGPILSAVPALLVALLVSPWTTLYVAILYIIVHQVENHVVNPLAQLFAVELPPALLVVAIVLFGVLFGPLGLLVGAPITVVGMELVKLLYVEETLGDRVEVPGRPTEGSGDMRRAG